MNMTHGPGRARFSAVLTDRAVYSSSFLPPPLPLWFSVSEDENEEEEEDDSLPYHRPHWTPQPASVYIAHHSITLERSYHGYTCRAAWQRESEK